MATPEHTIIIIQDVFVAAKTTEQTNVPKVKTSLPNVRYAMEIILQTIVDVLFSRTCNNSPKKQHKQNR